MYGGTKEEMQRLLADAEKLSGIKYDISSFDDIVQAIHVVQTEMGITGTTAKEAATTIQGSAASMKSAWQNLLTGMADEKQNLDLLFNQFIDSAVVFGNNLISRIQKLLPRIVTGISKLASSLAAQLPSIMKTLLPSLITGAVNIVAALIRQLPALVKSIITSLVKTIQSYKSTLQKSGADTLQKLLTGIEQNLPKVISKAADIIVKLVKGIANNLPQIIKVAGRIIGSLIKGIVSSLPSLVAKAPSIIASLAKGLLSSLGAITSVGVNIVKGLWQGISNAKDWVISKIRGFGDSILSSLKSFFGIHSPSTVMEKQVGKNLALGVANGITKNKKYAKKSAAELGQIIVDAAQKKLDKYKTYNNMTLTTEVEFWNQIRKQCKKGTDARLQADKNYFAAKKDLNEQLKALEDDYKAKIDEASQKIKDRTKEILNAFNLFDEFKLDIDEENPLTSDTLLNNLSSQVNALDDWTKEMATLKGKIGDTDLYAAVQEMGVNSLQQVKAINSMTEEQLNEYVELYNKRAELAKEQATTELGAEVMQEMTDAYKEYEDAVTKLGATVEKKYQGINNVIKTTMTDTDKITSEKMTTMISTFKNGTKSMAETVSTKFGSIGSKIVSTMSSAAVSLKSSVNSMIADLARLAAAQSAQQTTTATTKTTSAKGSSSSKKKTVKKNAAGGILTKPTIFGYTPSTGQWQLGGEAGDEAIAPIETLKQYVAEAVASQNGELVAVLQAILKAIKDQNLSVTLDGKEIANNVNKRLGVIY